MLWQALTIHTLGSVLSQYTWHKPCHFASQKLQSQKLQSESRRIIGLSIDQIKQRPEGLPSQRC